MTRYKIQTLKSLRDEMKAVARGGRPVLVDAAKPSFNSVEAAEFITHEGCGTAPQNAQRRGQKDRRRD
jgi:hypothetical protein